MMKLLKGDEGMVEQIHKHEDMFAYKVTKVPFIF